MAERPPKGYNRRDKPLPHLFEYNVGLRINSSGLQSFISSYIRTHKDTNDPTTIEVNSRNANFLVDTGSLICEDSIVQKMHIVKTYTMGLLMLDTDKIRHVKVFHSMYGGVFSDSWSPEDEKTSLAVEDILELTDDEATNMDVTPKFAGANFVSYTNHPVSNVTKTEVFGDLNLSVNLVPEGVAFDLDTYFNSKRFYTNGGKVQAASPFIGATTLTHQKPFYTTSYTKFIKQHLRFGRRDLYIGELHHLPQYDASAQITDPFDAPSASSQVTMKVICSYNEWNEDFNQKKG